MIGMIAPTERSKPKRQRVLYVWQSDYPWDVRTEKTCRALTEAGMSVHLAARNRRWEAQVEALPEALTHRLPEWRWIGRRADAVLQFPAFFNPRWIGLLSRIMRRERPEVILVRDLPLCPTAIWVGRWFGVPVVLDMAEHYAALTLNRWATGRQKAWDVAVRNPRWVAAVEDYCIRRVDHILVVVEESAARIVAKGAPRERIDVVSNTPPAARALQPRLDRPGSRRLELVHLGIHEVMRGILELIEAVKILRDQSVPVHATIIGSGRDAETFHARARELGLTSDNVTFTGYLRDHATALELVARADIGVLASRKCDEAESTIPNKLFDYMAAGLAVITSDVTPCARIVGETGAGEIFRAGDATDLAAAVRRLAENPDRRREAGLAGRRAIQGRYNWEHDSAVLRGVIDRVTAQRSPRPLSVLAWRGTPAA
jgi:glycosyltransferase involved in cell wall biosynthesis